MFPNIAFMIMYLAAPGFTLNDSKGAPVRLSDYKGRVVLLNFWATSCGACKIEIPWLIDFDRKYKDSGLAVIGVSMDEDGWKSVKPFVEKNRMRYPVVVGTEDIIKRYGVDAMPTTIMIDRNGRIAARHVGLVDKHIFESEIRMLIKSSSRGALNETNYLSFCESMPGRGINGSGGTDHHALLRLHAHQGGDTGGLGCVLQSD